MNNRRPLPTPVEDVNESSTEGCTIALSSQDPYGYPIHDRSYNVFQRTVVQHAKLQTRIGDTITVIILVVNVVIILTIVMMLVVDSAESGVGGFWPGFMSGDGYDECFFRSRVELATGPTPPTPLPGITASPCSLGIPHKLHIRCDATSTDLRCPAT